MKDFITEQTKSGPGKATIGVAVVSFLVGAAVVAYFAERDGFFGQQADEPVALAEPVESTAANPEEEATPTPLPTVTSEEVAEAAEAVERVEEQQGGLDQRIAALEQRIARLDLQAQAAAGNAARAEGLLIAFATRRALERGAELGFLADQLRLRFGDGFPNAVRIIIESSREPITLDQLVARLEGLGPELAEADDEPSFSKLWDDLGSLFVIRREDTPAPQPEKRLERARFFLESGRITAAISEVQNLPGAEKGENWIADARRYANVQDALERIETAAVLEPRSLRDGAGNRIEQPSPVVEANQN